MKSTYILILAVFSVFPFSVFAQLLSLDWAKNMSPIAGLGTSAMCVTTDQIGNVYTTGRFLDTMDLDPGAGVFNVICNGTDDVFIQKLDPDGNFIWGKSFGGVYDVGYAILADEDQNVYVAGHFQGTTDMDPGPGVVTRSSAGLDVFLLKLDINGDFVWAQTFGSSGVDMARHLAFDSMGNICMSGQYSSEMTITTLNGVEEVDPHGGADVFFMKFQPDGDPVWVGGLGGTSFDSDGGIAADSEGNVLITGHFRGAVDFDPSPAQHMVSSESTFADDVFILKLDSQGNFVWVIRLGSEVTEQSHSLTIDDDDNFFVSGIFSMAFDFDPGPDIVEYGSLNGNDLFIQKYDADANMLWTRVFGGIDDEYSYSMVTDSLGSLFIGGTFEATVDFDPGPGLEEHTSAGGADIYFTKYDSEGNFLWVQTLRGSNDEFIGGIALGDENRLFACGSYKSTNLDVDPSEDTLFLPLSVPTNGFVMQFQEDPCANLSIVYDSINMITCDNGLGYALIHPVHGAAPFEYSWNTEPVITGSVAEFNSTGVYTVSVTDAYSCYKTSSIFIAGPQLTNEFDLDINLLTTSFRPGFPAEVWLDGLNNGCIPTNGTIELVVDPLVMFDSAYPTPDIISGDTLIWEFDNLAFDSAHMTPQIFFTVSTDAEVGDKICFLTLMTPIVGDIDTLNNEKTYCFPVINGYDPNDVQVYPQGACGEDYVLKDQRLTYTVRFQNTGNAEAVHIRVIDSLSPFLDINTLQVKASSFPVLTEILPDNVLSFYFDSIMLPDSTNNEPLSHGYVIFEIDPLPSLADGVTATNQAGIYFDFNPPVITNEVTSTFYDILPCFLSTEELSETNVVVYPVPATNELFVKADVPVKSLVLRDNTGKFLFAASGSFVDVSALPAGLYFVEVATEQGVVVRRFIK